MGLFMQKSKSALLLMELIVVIFFFALTSAVCLQVFVKAHFVARDTKGLNYAVLWADNAAECFYEYKDDFEKTEDVLLNDFALEDYAMNIEFSKDADYLYMDYSFSDKKDDSVILQYTFRQHIKEVSK